MEPQPQILNNGQSILVGDFNALGEAAALADDRVLAELFRLQPFDGATVRRGIMPYNHAAWGALQFVAPNGATGSVLVNPFRAFIGSRTAVGTNAKANWRDTRSAVGVGSTTLAQVVTFAANASGNPRWDMIYAAVAVDANSASVFRKVKDPTTKAIASASTVVTKVTTVALGVQAGTPGASPSWPAAPADAAGTYYIPLAYVRIPNGFTAGSTIAKTDIAEAAPTLALSSATGGSSLQIANRHFTPEAANALTTAKVQTWGSTGTRPNMFLPPLMGGVDGLVVAVDLRTGVESHVTTGLVDSRDWRGRLARWTASIHTDDFPWAGGTGHRAAMTGAAITDMVGNSGFGNTMVGAASRMVAFLNGAHHAFMPDTSTIGIYCDNLDGGKLKVSYLNAPNVTAIFWIEFTPPWGNAG